MNGVDLTTARRERAEKMRARLDELEIDVLLLSIGADLPWLTGYEAMPLERPTVLVFAADADATLVVPRLEAPRVEIDEKLFSLHPYGETDDAVGIVADLVGERRRVAFSDRAWAGLLLQLQWAMTDATFVGASRVTGPLRAVKDAHEQEAIAKAGAAADRVAEALFHGEIGLVGRSEYDVSREISERLLAEGHRTVNFSIVGSGPNSASPHHEAGERVIRVGDVVVCDFGGSYVFDGDVGYCSDTTRTVAVGEPASEFRELYAVLEIAQSAALAAVEPGVTAEELDRVPRALIEDAGFAKWFIHRTGHGIGIEAHEEPYIVEGNREIVVPGNAFSIEPGIYLEGRFGARIEDIVVVTEDGSRPCNASEHGLVVLER
ncbi:MAG: aminopeptidase P family protein [Acidimicrobiales bacterium]